MGRILAPLVKADRTVVSREADLVLGAFRGFDRGVLAGANELLEPWNLRE